MSHNSYLTLILGIIFVLIGVLLWKKDRQQFMMLEDRLIQKEKYIYELYESLEQLMEDMDKLYKKSLLDETITEEFQHSIEQEYQEPSEDKNEIQDDRYKRENSKKLGEKVESKEDNEKDNIENVIIKLKNDGISEEDIAKRLGMGIGEVKLILELNYDRSKWT